MIKQACSLLLLFLVPLCMATADEQGGAEASTNVIHVQNFSLFDQYKMQHDQFFPKERVSIFALADRKGSDQLEDWITPFYTRYEEHVDICGIANLKGAPKMLHPMIRSLFRKGVDYPVMMDWKGAVCESLSYTPGVADIFILDTEGRVIHRVSGEASEEKLAACYVEIDRLMQEIEASDGIPPEDAPQAGPARQASESTSGELKPEW